MNIEDVKVGDFVYSYDTITGEVSQKEVTAVFVREVNHINYLTIVDEHGNEQVIETTDSHPFWVVTDEPDLERAAREYADGMYHENIDPGLNGFWVEAKDLREGDVFIGANGELSTLVSNERVEFPDGITVYNFTVDGNHNYFVIAQVSEYGQTCILVHNAEYNPQWHHMLPQKWREQFRLAGLNIDSAEFGLILDRTDHGKMSYSWNDEWNKFFGQFGEKGPNEAQIRAQLEKMKGMDKFKDVISKGTPAEIGYNVWKNGGKKAWQTTAQESAKNVAAKGAKRIPVVGLAFWASDVNNKGLLAGTLNTGLDNTPVVGWGKLGIELYLGRDLIPNKSHIIKP
jgi:hypothetical protein